MFNIQSANSKAYTNKEEFIEYNKLRAFRCHSYITSLDATQRKTLLEKYSDPYYTITERLGSKSRLNPKDVKDWAEYIENYNIIKKFHNDTERLNKSISERVYDNRQWNKDENRWDAYVPRPHYEVNTQKDNNGNEKLYVTYKAEISTAKGSVWEEYYSNLYSNHQTFQNDVESIQYSVTLICEKNKKSGVTKAPKIAFNINHLTTEKDGYFNNEKITDFSTIKNDKLKIIAEDLSKTINSDTMIKWNKRQDFIDENISRILFPKKNKIVDLDTPEKFFKYAIDIDYVYDDHYKEVKEKYDEFYSNKPYKEAMDDFYNRITSCMKVISESVYDNRQWLDYSADKDAKCKGEWDVNIPKPMFKIFSNGINYDNDNPRYYIICRLSVSTVKNEDWERYKYRDTVDVNPKPSEKIDYTFTFYADKDKVYGTFLDIGYGYINADGFFSYDNSKLINETLTDVTLRKIHKNVSEQLYIDKFVSDLSFYEYRHITLSDLPKSFLDFYRDLGKQIYQSRKQCFEYDTSNITQDITEVDELPDIKAKYYDLNSSGAIKQQTIGDIDIYNIGLFQLEKDKNKNLETIELIVACNNKTNECIFYPNMRSTFDTKNIYIDGINDIQTPKIKYIIEQLSNKFDITEDKVKSIKDLITPEIVRNEYNRVVNIVNDTISNKSNITIQKPTQYNDKWNMSIWYTSLENEDEKINILKYHIDKQYFTYTKAETIQPFKAVDGLNNLFIKDDEALSKMPDVFQNICTATIEQIKEERAKEIEDKDEIEM